MSQPLGIIARIEIAEDAYKSYLRSKAVKELAKSMFYTIKHDDKDFYIFQYNKKEQVLSVLIYYHYGNSETLKGGDFVSLKAIEPFLLPDNKGYVVGTHDSLNWVQADFAYAYTLENGVWKDHQKLDRVIYDQLLSDVDKLYKKLDGNFSDKVFSSRIVDTSIVKKIRNFKEQDRLENLINKLDEASVTKPLYFFGDYYYNGVCLYHRSGKALLEIDPRTFVQKPYGAADGSHVVIHGKVLKTDPKKFKKLQKIDTIYYVSEEAVYEGSYGFTLMPNADSATFVLKQECVAEDKNYLYIFSKQVLKSDIGEYKIVDYGYNKAIIVYGKKAVYIDGDKIESVDPLTLERLECVSGKGYVGNDKLGFLVLTWDKEKTSYTKVLRGQEAERILEIEAEKEETNPKRLSAEEQLIEEIESPNFESEYKEKKYNNYLLRQINNYFYLCFQNWSKTRDKTELDKILKIYNIVEETAWANPHLFHHTACVYAVMGDIEKAVQEVRKAYIFGYEYMDKIWEDNDLNVLHSDSIYRQLEETYKIQKKHSTRPVINNEVLTRLRSMSALDLKLSSIMSEITKRFVIPDKPNVEIMAQANRNVLPDGFWDTYLDNLRYFFQIMFGAEDLYNTTLYHGAYSEYELMPPLGHLLRMEYEFRHAHIAGPKIEDALNTLNRLRKSLSRITDETEKQALIETVNSSEIMKILGERV